MSSARILTCKIPLLDGESLSPPRVIESELALKNLARLQSILQREEILFERLLCTSWALLLRCYTGQDDVCFQLRRTRSDTLVEKSANREHLSIVTMDFEEKQTISHYTTKTSGDLGVSDGTSRCSNTIVQIDNGNIYHLPEPSKVREPYSRALNAHIKQLL